MKIPAPPPASQDLWQKVSASPDKLLQLMQLGKTIRPDTDGEYQHWDELRHHPAPAGLTAEQHWFLVKNSRQQLYRELPMKDVNGAPFQYCLTPSAFELLHQIDRDASGIIGAPQPINNPQTQATYLLKSLVEEAIRSSQLEGASTTRRVAKDMLLQGREPRDHSERMIFNNYTAMQSVRAFKREPLTPARVLELQSTLTNGTLDEIDAAGRYRRTDEHIVVSDETGRTLHDPPAANELPQRMELLCDFANGGGTTEFLHPVIRAILVHFTLAYDHPFVDGNGRTARALFYWVMAREGYWLCEYVSISRILKKARAQYARSFLYTETDENDATYFIAYQLRVLTSAIRDLHSYLERKSGEINDVETLIRHSTDIHADLNARQLDLLTHALKNPNAFYTIESHRRSHGVAYATSRSDLMELAKLGLLEQRKRSHSFVYIAPADLERRLNSVAP